MERERIPLPMVEYMKGIMLKVIVAISVVSVIVIIIIIITMLITTITITIIIVITNTGKKHGKGKMTHSSGDIYEGDFVEGDRCC